MLTVIVPVRKTRLVIVHYHIFKNGGSTIESVLNRQFGDAFATLHGPTENAVLDGSDLLDFLASYPGVKAVSSHHLRYPKPEERTLILFDCCFLRDPLTRLHSEYSYFNRVDSDDPFCLMAHRYSARDFISRLLDESPNRASNVQVTELACASAFTRPANEDDLDRASSIVRQMAIPGVVELFDESLVAAEYYLKPAFPRLRLDYVAKNVSPAAAGRDADLAAVWGSAVYDRVARLNQLDLELVRRARDEIACRLGLIPSCSRLLAEFRDRCRARAAASAGCQGALLGTLVKNEAAAPLYRMPQ